MPVTKLQKIFGTLAVAASLFGTEIAFAQNATAPSSMKTIGTPTAAAKSEIVPSLFVLNSRGATLQADTLTLTVYRPARSSSPTVRYDPRATSPLPM